MATKAGRKMSSSQPSTTSDRQPGKSLSPTRHFRLQEKHDLQNLNDRLACYIDKVRYLEAENARLTKEVQTKEETVTREVSNIKSIYDFELADARKLLDETSMERAKLEIDVKRLVDDCENLQSKYNKRNKECKTAEQNAEYYSRRFNELQTQFTQSQNEKKKLLQREKELEKEVAMLQSQLADARKHLEEETLHRVELENHLQSLKESASFQNQVLQQELTETRTRRLVETSEIDGKLAEQYEAKLQQSLQQLREQYEAQMLANREQIEALYETKIKNLQQQENRHNGATTVAVGELRQIRVKIDNLNKKIDELESTNNVLNSRIRELDNMRDIDKTRYAEHLAALEADLDRMREEMSRQLKEYQDLMDIRVALDLEIAAYRKLLESEEARLNITPVGSRSGTPTRESPTRANSSLAGKRKRTHAESEESSIQDFSSSKGDIVISEAHPEGKYVKLTNNGNKQIGLGGWKLQRTTHGSDKSVFKFHRSVKIEPGASIFVWSSDCGATHDPPSNIVMKGQKWFVADNMLTTLTNDNGQEMAKSKRLCMSLSRLQDYSLSSSDELDQNDPQGEERCYIM